MKALFLIGAFVVALVAGLEETENKNVAPLSQILLRDTREAGKGNGKKQTRKKTAKKTEGTKTSTTGGRGKGKKQRTHKYTTTRLLKESSFKPC